jgi:hypothetical protein
LLRHDTIRCRESPGDNSRAVAIHRVGSHLRAGDDGSRSCCRSRRGFIDEKRPSEIPVSVKMPLT